MRGASGVGYQTTRSHAQHVKKRAEENTWVSTWTGEQLVGKRRWRAMECHGERGSWSAMTTVSGSWSAMTTAREERKPLTNQGTTLRRRCVYGARGARLTHSQTATPEKVSTPQDSRLGKHEHVDDPDEKKPKRADPQRVEERTHSG